MTVLATLFTGGTVAGFPNPNTLTTVSPYADPFPGRTNVQTAWKNQNKPGLFLRDPANSPKNALVPLHFVPSVDAATYTLVMWKWSRIPGKWVQPKDNATLNFTGPMSTYIENPDEDPVYFQISALSSGTLAAYYDDAKCFSG